MSNTLRIKRRAAGGAAGAPASLQNAELAYNEQDDTLYIGKGTGGAGGSATTVIAIAGPGTYAPLASPALTGTPTAPTASADTSTTQLATTAYVLGQASSTTPIVNGTAAIGSSLKYARADHVHGTDTSRAAVASPTFTGTPAAPTAAADTVTTQLATTAFVTGQASATNPLMNGAVAIGTSLKYARADHVHATDTTRAPLASPTFTGTPAAPTAITTDNSTTIATTAFVKAQGYITQNQSITVSGDVSGSGTTAISTTLASVGTAGTYTKVTTDAKGRVTAGTTLSASDIPTLTAAKISDFDIQVRTSRLDQMAAPTASVSMNSQNLTGLADPVNAQDAATKNYVDLTVQGLDPKQSVKAATVANVASLSGTMTIDGVALVAGDRVLVKDQTTTTANGIYVVAAGAWSRSLDADSWAELPGAYVFAEAGTVNADMGFVCTVEAGGTLGTTPIAFQQFSGAGQISAGAGLTKTGNTIDVVGTAGRIVANADSIDLASGIVSAGTYKSVTVDTYGRVTAGSNPTTLSGYGITDAQPLDATLTALAGVTTAADRLIYATGADVFAVATFTSFARTLLDDADAATARATLGLDTMATQAASNVAVTGGSITNLTTFDGITIDGGTF
jgi:hypothetical protein